MSNAMVKRIFNIINVIKNKIRNRITTEMLIFIIKSHSFNNYCKNFIYTQDMFKKFNNSMHFCKNEVDSK